MLGAGSGFTDVNEGGSNVCWSSYGKGRLLSVTSLLTVPLQG